MPAPSGGQQARLDRLEQRMDKTEEILMQMKEAVIMLKSKSEANHTWIMACLTIGCTLLGAGLGTMLSYILLHFH